VGRLYPRPPLRGPVFFRSRSGIALEVLALQQQTVPVCSAVMFIAGNSLLHLRSTDDILANSRRRHLAWRDVRVRHIQFQTLGYWRGPRASGFRSCKTELFGTLSVEGTSEYVAAKKVNYGCRHV
jgi:hypothetical protein